MLFKGKIKAKYLKNRKHFLIFFLDDFHQGAVNHITHFIGFTLLGYGLGIQNLLIILISPLLMEMGHVWNYFTGRYKDIAIKIIPIQIIFWIIFVIIGYLLAKTFQIGGY